MLTLAVILADIANPMVGVSRTCLFVGLRWELSYL